MGLDIRLPIGGLFTVLGLLLILYGVIGDSSVYQRSLGINVNLYWGLVMLAFGLIMAGLAQRGRAAKDSKTNVRPGPPLPSSKRQ